MLGAVAMSQQSASELGADQTPKTTTVIVTTENHRPGALEAVLRIFRESGINLTRIHSLPSREFPGAYEFTIDYETAGNEVKGEALMEKLRSSADVMVKAPPVRLQFGFPRTIQDLDQFTHKTLDCGEDLSADHPGFTDPVYRARREAIVKVARTYRHGQEIPRIEYTAEEKATWGEVYSRLRKLMPTHACKQYAHIFPLLERQCGYGVDNIPQLEDISRFLKSCTGFSLRPVTGLLSARDFLNGLAFRVFHSTQYIRHHSRPLYTPEPDVCHELLGHVPLFADPDFAAFSQEIGLASLGVSDDDITRLASCYWFTVEFGLCRQDGELKAFGAGLLSSFGELEYCLSGKPKLLDFDPAVAAVHPYPITEYQPVYFVADSFASAQAKMKAYSSTLARPYEVAYNPYTQGIEVIESTSHVINMVEQVKNQADRIIEALRKL